MRSRIGFFGGVIVGVAFVACGRSERVQHAVDMASNAVTDMAVAMGDLLGHDGSVSSDGAAPSGDGPLEMSKADAQSFSCTPDVAFCESGKLYQCTRSGTDAWGGITCSGQSGGSATNPITCATSKCYGGVACCRKQNPGCGFALTAPLASSGDEFDYGALSGQAWCTASKNCDYYSWSWYGAPNGCGSYTGSASLSVKIAIATPGSPITLPNAAVNLSSSNGTSSCSAWSGSVTISGGTTNTATVNVTCTETGKESMKVIGTLTANY